MSEWKEMGERVLYQLESTEARVEALEKRTASVENIVTTLSVKYSILGILAGTLVTLTGFLLWYFNK